ncbi:ArsR/SmtB family transcription factor [Penaeicola halotolerans]|uniref:ArsR/SmtB family transcription factor n=1 Tax=Penaeicola halotolerans TaxID=2793196 RepID=UPI001CF84805|nr:helix-turn-helix transcriptional regulator [Penaeicola halotolerans]
MAKIQKDLFSKKDVEYAALSKCLAHPARLMILDILSKHKDRTCKELVFDIPLSQSTVSKHLNDLLAIGLICRKVSGAQSLYTLEWNKLTRFFELTNRLSKGMMPHRPKRNCC